MLSIALVIVICLMVDTFEISYVHKIFNMLGVLVILFLLLLFIYTFGKIHENLKFEILYQLDAID